MKILLSTFYSNDDMRTALVYKDEQGYEVTVLDSYSGREKTYNYPERQLAENFAEDWVL